MNIELAPSHGTSSKKRIIASSVLTDTDREQEKFEGYCQS
jgi:hypothetical protein